MHKHINAHWPYIPYGKARSKRPPSIFPWQTNGLDTDRYMKKTVTAKLKTPQNSLNRFTFSNRYRIQFIGTANSPFKLKDTIGLGLLKDIL